MSSAKGYDCLLHVPLRDGHKYLRSSSIFNTVTAYNALLRTWVFAPLRPCVFALLRLIPLRLFARVVIGYLDQLTRLCKDAAGEPSVLKPHSFLVQVIAVQIAAIQEPDDLFAQKTNLDSEEVALSLFLGKVRSFR